MFLFSEDISSMLPGQEAIDFQLSSSLGKKLSNLFQMVIDYRDNLDYSKISDNATEQRLHRIRSVNQYFKSQIADKVRSVISDETGLKIKRLIPIGGVDADVYGFFAVDLSFDSMEQSFETIGRITGTDNGKYTSDRDAVMEMATMADQFDTKTGKLKKAFFGKDRQIAADIYFDVNCAFLVQDFLPVKTSPQMTAGEIAAIIMHEVGHVLTVVENSANMYVTYKRVTDHLRALKNTNDPSELLRMIKEYIKPILHQWSKTVFDDAKTTKLVQRVSGTLIEAINGLYSYNTSEDQTSESWVLTIGSFTCNLLTMALYMIVMVFISTVFFIYGGALLYEICRYGYVDKTSGDTKASDVKTNYNNTFLLERWADEYVSRHGYGAELTSGLNKINDYFKYDTTGTITSARVRNSTLFNALCIAFGWVMDKIVWLNYLDPIGYENQYQRAARVLQNTYGFFKNTDVPGSVVDQWIRSVETIKGQMQQAKTLSDTTFGKALYNSLKNLSNPVRWIVLVKDGNLDRDTEILANRLDDLINNPFYYQSQKLKSLR